MNLKQKLIGVVLLCQSSLSLADFEYSHGSWVLSPQATLEKRTENKALTEQDNANLLNKISKAITYWKLDGKTLTYTDNNGKVSTSEYEAVQVDGENFEMVFVQDGQQVGGAIQIERVESGFCATFMISHSNSTGLLNSHADCYQREKQ